MKKIDEHAVIRVVIATGISSVVTQLLVIREYLAQFKGNEFVIALILFSWLLLGGLGTMAANLLAARGFKAAPRRLGGLSIVLAAITAPELILIRGARDLVFIHGSSVGFYPTFFFIFITLAPYGLLVGFLLPYSLFVLRTTRGDYPAGNIYIMDNLGDILGGGLFTFLLVYLLTPLQAAAMAATALVIAALPLYRGAGRAAFWAWAGTLGAAMLSFFCVIHEHGSLAPPEGELIYYQESRYGRIAVHKDQEQVTLFSDGMPLFSNQNLVTAEEVIHYPLVQLDHPRNLLLISSEGGMMAELAKYHPHTIDLIELDPEIAKVLFQFNLVETIPGLRVIHQDGRAYLRDTEKQYDAIIINLPEPETFQLNRFYTEEFFRIAKRRLVPGGILSFAMEGYDNYLSEFQRRKLSALFHTVKTQFREVLLLPGQQIFFLCRDGAVRSDIPDFLAEKSIPTEYISRYFSGNLTPGRIAELNGLIEAQIPKNQDASPSLMQLMFSQWFAQYGSSPAAFFAVLSIVLLFYLRRLHAEEFVLFSSGFMSMGFEVLVIFAFQIYFGFIYHRIGLIVTVFLAGLLPGAWLGIRFQNHGRRLLVFTDSVLIIMAGLYIVLITSGWEHLPEALFLFLGFTVSLTCGCQFPVVLHLRGGDNPAAARSFSADLVGAACGTLITSVVMIPYAGIVWAAWGLIGLKSLSLVLGFKR